MSYKDLKLNYSDVSIVPEVTSRISSRTMCNCTDENNRLPIIAAPMSTVVDEASAKEFYAAGMYCVLPRTLPIAVRRKYLFEQSKYKCFVAVSLEEFQDLFIYNRNTYERKIQARVCLDVANGHQLQILNMITRAKNIHPNLCVMAGNIANPVTYLEYERYGVDYCRVGIGTGSSCLTSSNTGIHFPQFSLLEEIYKLKCENKCKCKIVADGGIKGYRDVQKALIFADYVMIGGLFNKAIDSAGEVKYGNCYFNLFGEKILRPIKTLLFRGRTVKKITPRIIQQMKSGTVEFYKEFYGMSTKKAQQLINNNKALKTSEGIVKKNKVEYTLSGWADNERDYLRSAMSYTNSATLDEYKGSKYVRQCNIAYNN
jgi:IMP dehydrogenase/GMP reductase